MHNLCLLGYGRIGKLHYKNIINNPLVNLKYIYDIEEKRNEINNQLKNEPTKNSKIIITSNLTEIINDIEVDICLVCTPTNTHYSIIMSLLEARKHIFCEKPLANQEEEVINCYNLATTKNLVLLCAFNRRFDPDIIKLKEDCSKIGKIHQIITISRDFPYPTVDYLKISSGIFSDCAIHDIDYINWILNDKPRNVYVTGNIVTLPYVGAEELDNAIIILEYSHDILVNINVSRISKNYDQRIEIYGFYDKISLKNPYENDTNPISFPERYNQSYKNELDHFLNVIEKKEEIKITMEDCLNNIQIIAACERSLQTSSKVSIKYGSGFRNYNNVINSVRDTYYKSRTKQTVEYVEKMHRKYLTFDKKINIKDIFKNLDTFTDISDPDISLPNSLHGYQTAEGIRHDNYPEWLQLVGLIHDIGKILYIKGCDKDGTSMKEQWGLVGDTFIVGCQLPDNIIFSEFNKENPDMQNPHYNTKLGIYKSNCGLDQVNCSWGHDEYLYQILKFNNIPLPEEALYIIRFHSLYSYHTHDAYKFLMDDKDYLMLDWLKTFNSYDLYTKSDNLISDDTKGYYDKLIEQFFGNGDLWI